MCKSFALSAQQDILLLNVYLSFLTLNCNAPPMHTTSHFLMLRCITQPYSTLPLCNISFLTLLCGAPPLRQLIFLSHATTTILCNPLCNVVSFFDVVLQQPPFCIISFIDISSEAPPPCNISFADIAMLLLQHCLSF